MRELVAALLLPLVLAGPVGAGGPAVELTFKDPDIIESSGLAVVGPWVVTTNDSGDTGRVFVVDRSGATVGRKWRPSTSMSFETASCRPARGAISAQSSPMPRTARRVGRVKYRSMSSNSPIVMEWGRYRLACQSGLRHYPSGA